MTHTYPGVTGSGEFLISIVKQILGDTSHQSMIDLCCAHATCTSRIGFKKRKYVDIQPWRLDDQSEQQFFFQENALDQKGSFDVALCFDGIEHFVKDDGYKLIKVMQSLAPARVLFTPLGEYKVIHGTDVFDDHKSGWMPKDAPEFASLVFPNWHPELNCGAFFLFQTKDTERDFRSFKIYDC